MTQQNGTLFGREDVCDNGCCSSFIAVFVISVVVVHLLLFL